MLGESGASSTSDLAVAEAVAGANPSSITDETNNIEDRNTVRFTWRTYHNDLVAQPL